MRYATYVTFCITAALCGLTLLPPRKADATCRQRAVVVQRRAAVVVQKVVVAKVIPVAVFAPVAAYGASYNPYLMPPPVASAPRAISYPSPGYGQSPVPTDSISDTQAIILLLTRLDERLKKVEAAINLPFPTPDKAPLTTPAPGADRVGGGKADKVPGIFSSQCASCHTQGKLNAGTTFEMFDPAGKLLALNERQWGRVGSKVATGKMPPPKKGADGGLIPVMSDEEASAIAEWLDARK